MIEEAGTGARTDWTKNFEICKGVLRFHMADYSAWALRQLSAALAKLHEGQLKWKAKPMRHRENHNYRISQQSLLPIFSYQSEEIACVCFDSLRPNSLETPKESSRYFSVNALGIWLLLPRVPRDRLQ